MSFIAKTVHLILLVAIILIAKDLCFRDPERSALFEFLSLLSDVFLLIVCFVLIISLN